MKYIIAAIIIVSILIYGFIMYNRKQDVEISPTFVAVEEPWWYWRWPWWYGYGDHGYSPDYRIHRNFSPSHHPVPFHGRVGGPGGHPRGPIRH